MRLRDYLEPETINLDVGGNDRDDVYDRLVGQLQLGDQSAATVVRQLLRREMLGSTGFGQGIAIPHCRTLAVTRLRLAFGIHQQGVSMQALDGQPVHVFFVIVAPPIEVSNEYLPVLGRIAQLAREPGIPERLRTLRERDDLYRLLDEKGV